VIIGTTIVFMQKKTGISQSLKANVLEAMLSARQTLPDGKAEVQQGEGHEIE
jgi:hypothetical protein